MRRYAGREGFTQGQRAAHGDRLWRARVGFSGGVGHRGQGGQAGGGHADGVVHRGARPALSQGDGGGFFGVAVGTHNDGVGAADGQGVAEQAAGASTGQAAGVVGRHAAGEGFSQGQHAADGHCLDGAGVGLIRRVSDRGQVC